MYRREDHEQTSVAGRGRRDVGGWARRLGPEVAGTAVPFALVLYLGLRGGGYDEVVRSEIGIVVWLVVGIASLVGLLPISRPPRAAIAGLALLGGLLAWTAASLLWTESVENTYSELARVAIYLGVFTYALFVQGPGAARRMVIGVGAAIGVVALLAVLSRFHPAWFPPNDYAEVFPDQQSRLNYPLNYPNGVAALMALGAPLLAVLGTSARSLPARALATAALPLLALATFLTFSRGGLVIAVLGLAVLVLAYPRRRDLVPTLALGAFGSAMLALAVVARDDLENGLATELARRQGDEMIALTVAVLVVIAALRVGLERLPRERVPKPPSLPSPSRRQVAVIGAGVALVAVVALVASGAGSDLSQRWEEFKDPRQTTGATERLSATGGNGRYQYWDSALDAFRSEPVTGIGAGSYEYWWARNGSLPGAIRDAHSLYFETLGELGLPGLALLIGLAALVLVQGARGLRAAEPGDRAALAGALAAAVVFILAAANDWVWELPAITVAFLLVAAPLLSWRREEAQAVVLPGGPVVRRAAGATAVVALIAVITISWLGARLVKESESATASGDLDTALEAARSAQDVQPFAATPYLLEATTLFRQSRSDPALISPTTESALQAAHEATEREPTNWRTWYSVWEVEKGTGQEPEAAAAFERAESLNPRSGLFASLDEG